MRTAEVVDRPYKPHACLSSVLLRRAAARVLLCIGQKKPPYGRLPQEGSYASVPLSATRTLPPPPADADGENLFVAPVVALVGYPPAVGRVGRLPVAPSVVGDLDPPPTACVDGVDLFVAPFVALIGYPLAAG